MVKYKNLNDVSEEVKQMIPPMKGEVIFQMLNGSPNNDNDRNERERQPMFYGKTQIPTKVKIKDPKTQKFVDIGAPMEVDNDNVISYRPFLAGKDDGIFNGKFSLMEGKAVDEELYEVFWLSPFRQGSPFAEAGTKPLFKIVNFKEESTKTLGKVEKLREALELLKVFTEVDYANFAASQNWTETDPEFIKAAVSKFAKDDYDKFLLIAKSDDTIVKANIKRAFDKQILAFDRKIRVIQKEAIGLSKDAVLAIEKVLQKHRLVINDLIKNSSDSTSIKAFNLPTLSQQIQSEVNVMISEATKIVKDAQAGVFQIGVTQGLETAQAIGLQTAFLMPTPHLLVIATNYTADHITGLGSDLMGQINGVIQRVVLDGQNPFDAMKSIDEVIGRGGAGGVSYQAERIVRTEVNRVYSIATDATVNEFGKQVKGLKKQWVSGAFRAGRREYHQSENVNDGLPIPFNQPFMVGGEPLDYPRDPKGSPENTINCGCQMIMVVDDVETS